MYYRKALRQAGFNPADITNAEKADEFTIRIGPKELKGSVIGDPMHCAGANACKKQHHATWAWVGASMAILAFSDGKLMRYVHNGQIPKKQDEGMFPIGVFRFSQVKESRRPEARHLRRFSKSVNPDNPSHISKNLRKGIAFRPEPSLAAQMRRGWEVETD